MIAIGVDPGLHGAIAVVDTEKGRVLEVVDIPTFETFVGKKKRRRLDEAQLLNEVIRINGLYHEPHSAALLVTIEQVGPQPKDGAVGAFAFGVVYGSIRMAFKAAGYRSEHARPQDWKKALHVPALKDAAVSRADDLFPQDGGLWRGPRGGALPDRAEAAMIARYGAEKLSGPVKEVAA